MKKESKPIQNQDDKLINYNYKKIWGRMRFFSVFAVPVVRL